MTTSRTWLLGRSVLYGVIVKFSGAAFVFVGLPVIAGGLSVSDYATFLVVMTISSSYGLPFGVISILSIRQMSYGLYCPEGPGSANTQTLCLHIGVSILGLVIAFVCLTVIDFGPIGWFGFITISVAGVLQGMFLWGDSHNVAARADYRSSSVQTIINLLLIGVVLGLTNASLFEYSVLYIGLPLVGQAFIFARSMRGARFDRVTNSHVMAAVRQLPELWPMAVVSLSNYLVIYVSGALIALISGHMEYAKYTTIVLMCARLTNPVTLLTRPLLPAYVDAHHSGDVIWIKRARQIGTAVFLGGLVVGVLLLSTSWPMLGLNALFPKLDIDGGSAAGAVAVLFGGATAALLAPFYYATRHDRLYALLSAFGVVIGLLAGSMMARSLGSAGMLMGLGGSMSLISTIMFFLAYKLLLK